MHVPVLLIPAIRRRASRNWSTVKLWLSPTSERAAAITPRLVGYAITRIEAELLVRRPDGNWPEMADILTTDDQVALPSIGFAAPLAAFYRTTTLAR